MRFVETPSSWSWIVRIVAEADDREIAELLDLTERGEIVSLRAVQRQRERTASRVAAKSLALERGFVDLASRIRFAKADARPVVFVDGAERSLFVSFSHTAGIGAAALHDSPVGIDLEHERVIDPRATKFFLRDDELAVAASCRVENALLHWWCAKEAAFKLAAEYPTLLRVPLALESETADGLVLRGPRDARVETVRLGSSLVAALAL
ncbi:MAG: 4'-phosphopantetheinyl transferase family protein [Thermoanaerobaculia bacterium]